MAAKKRSGKGLINTVSEVVSEAVDRVSDAAYTAADVAAGLAERTRAQGAQAVEPVSPTVAGVVRPASKKGGVSPERRTQRASGKPARKTTAQSSRKSARKGKTAKAGTSKRRK